MDVLSLLLKRTQHAIGTSLKDSWLEEIINSNDEEIAIILTENILNHMGINRDAITTLREQYSLKAMFDMKNPYSNTNVNFLLYVFSKRKTTSIIYGIYKNTIKTQTSHTDKFILKDEFPESYFTYIENIEKYINSEIAPEDTDFHEFGEFNKNIFSEKHWNPNRYSKTVIKIQEALKKEKSIPLGELATIIRPRQDIEKRHTDYCALPNSWTYPIDYSKMKKGILTDCILHKGDIIFLDNQKMFLVYEEPNREIHTSHNCYIIRPNNICPEYLYIYLNSETAQVVMNAETCGTIIKRIRKDDLSNLPIILPVKDDQYYRKIFYANNFLIKDFEGINKAIYDIQVSNSEESIEDILDLELINNLKVYKENIKEKILDEDLKEINICFKHKAYKATLILAGSILEAMLIDWLSELHGKNYFEEEYIDYHGKHGTLAIYIRDIKHLKRPGWIDESEKAHTIRERRNQVHTKLCLKSEEITEELCREVIGYLSDVLKTRNGKTISRKVFRYIN